MTARVLDPVWVATGYVVLAWWVAIDIAAWAGL